MKNMLIEKVVQLILTDPKYTSAARFGYFQGFENLRIKNFQSMECKIKGLTTDAVNAVKNVF